MDHKVTCECGHLYTIKKVGKKSVSVHKGQKVKSHYFMCPECDLKTRYLYQNDDVRKIQKKNAKLKEKFNPLVAAKKATEAKKVDNKISMNMVQEQRIKVELMERFSL